MLEINQYYSPKTSVAESMRFTTHVVTGTFVLVNVVDRTASGRAVAVLPVVSIPNTDTCASGVLISLRRSSVSYSFVVTSHRNK